MRHLSKKFNGSHISATESECGNKYPVGGKPMLLPLSAFRRQLLRDSATVCGQCAAAAIKSGRICVVKNRNEFLNSTQFGE